jgi:prephenate dehydrogenase
MFARLAVVGCGLLGASLAGAWRAAGVARQVCVYDTDAARAARAVERGLADRASADLADALAGADVVAIATPVGVVPALLPAIALLAPEQAILTDVGSTKAGVMAAAQALGGARAARFVGAHPIAGGELPGVEHARADLFEGRWVITTPGPDTDPAALAAIEAAWRGAGAVTERMDAPLHDRVFAAVSHLPHLLAFALVETLVRTEDGVRSLRYAGAGYRDFTRIAASDPVMWRDIALANQEALGAALREYRASLDALQHAVDGGDAAALLACFGAASQARRGHEFTPGGDGGSRQ